jgi:hypothetical protein
MHVQDAKEARNHNKFNQVVLGNQTAKPVMPQEVHDYTRKRKLILSRMSPFKFPDRESGRFVASWLY